MTVRTAWGPRLMLTMAMVAAAWAGMLPLVHVPAVVPVDARAGDGGLAYRAERTVLMLRQGQPLGASVLQLRLIELLRQQLVAGYLRAYRALRPCPDSAIEAWVPVIAAARLSEGIETERDQLLALAARGVE